MPHGSIRSTGGGGEFGKVLARRIVPELKNLADPHRARESSTNALIRRDRQARRPRTK